MCVVKVTQKKINDGQVKSDHRLEVEEMGVNTMMDEGSTNILDAETAAKPQNHVKHNKNRLGATLNRW